jgi:hypothetical protein
MTTRRAPETDISRRCAQASPGLSRPVHWTQSSATADSGVCGCGCCYCCCDCDRAHGGFADLASLRFRLLHRQKKIFCDTGCQVHDPQGPQESRSGIKIHVVASQARSHWPDITQPFGERTVVPTTNRKPYRWRARGFSSLGRSMVLKNWSTLDSS